MKFQLLSACVVSLLLVTTEATVPVIQSDYWAGSVVIDEKAGWKEVTGTIVVPTINAPPGTNGNASAAVWVGIDGTGSAKCNGQILQTGITMSIANNKVTYYAWHEWWPDLWTSWPTSAISFRAGDSVTMTVTTSSNTSGSTTVTNHSTGKTVTYHFAGHSNPLAGCDAEWIVEDWQSASGVEVPFANFDTVTFTNARATAANGSVYGPGGNPSSTIYKLVENGETLSSCSATTTSATCSYV